MNPIKPQTGFVAFFDILGYKQIILNNDIHKTAQIVSDTLSTSLKLSSERARAPLAVPRLSLGRRLKLTLGSAR